MIFWKISGKLLPFLEIESCKWNLSKYIKHMWYWQNLLNRILFATILLDILTLFLSSFACSPHAVTGSIGLALLTIQTILPMLFEVKEKCYTMPLSNAEWNNTYFKKNERNLSISVSMLIIFGIGLLTSMQGNPGIRNVHGILGSGIMTLFLVHAALGLQLGLSY